MSTEPLSDTDVRPETETVTRAELDEMRGEFHQLLKKELRVPVEDSSEFSLYLDTARFDHCWRIATLFSKSNIVPESFRGKIEDCFIAVQMAIRCGVDPFMFLQKCYVVHGRPGIEAQLAIALANASGIFKGRLSYTMEGSGDKRQCICQGIIADTSEVVKEIVSVQIAKDMGWWKQNPLWSKMTDLMLKYRSAMWLIRTNCPEVLMGMYAKDELEEMHPGEIDAKGANTAKKARPSALNEELKENGKAEPAEEQLPDVPVPSASWEPIEAEMAATTNTAAAAEVFHRYEGQVDDPDRLKELADKQKLLIRGMRGDSEPATKQGTLA